MPVLSAAKLPISLRVDADVFAFFGETGPHDWSRMNAVLRSYMERMAKQTPEPPKQPEPLRKRRGIA